MTRLIPPDRSSQSHLPDRASSERMSSEGAEHEDRVHLRRELEASALASAVWDGLLRHRDDVTPDVDEAWIRTRERWVGHSSSGMSRKAAQKAWHRGLPWTGFGLAAILVVAMSLVAVRANRSTPTSQRYHTAPGQRSAVRFADGSTILLAPATTITMTATKSAREFTVTGEALFSVTSQSAQPVVVRTQNSVVRVLGTRFNVRQYPDESTSHVVVEDGKVSVDTRRTEHSTSNPTVLSSQMLAQVSDSGITVTPGIAVQDYTGLTRGVLVFNGVTLNDAVAELSRVYGTEVRVVDPMLQRRKMRMEVSIVDLPLAHVLTAIADVLDARVTRDGHGFVITPGGSASQPQPPAVVQPRHHVPQSETQYGR